MRPALFDAPSDDVVADALSARARRRIAPLPDAAVADLIADTVFLERKRLETDGAPPEYEALIERAARCLRPLGRDEMDRVLYALVDYYAREIHNPFSPRTYRFATRILPGALTRLLSASRGRDLVLGDYDPASRIVVDGPLAELRALAERATLILAPTHVSNLDSPLIGYALYAAGLPPFAYGAGLNLFSNPAMAFFMKRLGAYTVDRRKRTRLYKDTLKDYSVEILRRRTHSLFFPGGTRSRSGRLERQLKKGLLGTGLLAWQENLAAGRTDDVFVVPCTLSIGLVLEAETLIADALAEEGKQRYIIMDDEFGDARTVASFVRRYLQLDARVHVVFGSPMDVTGNPLGPDHVSLDPHGDPVDRRGYVMRDGTVVFDDQRDHVYTERLARHLCEAYRRDFVIQSTHLAAWAAWEALRASKPGLDTWRLVRLPSDQRIVRRVDVEQRIDDALTRIDKYRRIGPATGSAILDEAIRHFAGFHKVRAIAPEGPDLRLDAQLVLYYRNRLEGHGLSPVKVRLVAAEREIGEMFATLVAATGSVLVEDAPDLIILAIPPGEVRATLHRVKPGPADRVVLATRGLEPGSGRRLSTLVEAESACLRVGVLAGPMLPGEVKRNSPCAAVVASRFDEVAEVTSGALHSPLCRVYPSHDLLGVELAGALVDVVATALGAARGLGLGVGTQALVVSRGIAEGTRLAKRVGGDPRTFGGLAGAGELIACMAVPDHFAQRRGLALARGEVDTALAATCSALLQIERDLPITAGVMRVARGEIGAADAISGLLSRDVRDEFDG